MGDVLERLVERLDVPGRLVVELAQQRLPEVGDVGALEPAHEPLRSRDPDLDAVQRAHGAAALQDDDARLLEHRADLAGASCMAVVVAEHGEDRRRQAPAGIGQDRGLLGLAVSGDVAREKDEVDGAVQSRERRGDLVTGALAAMQIAGRRDSQALRRMPVAAGSGVCHTGWLPG